MADITFAAFFSYVHDDDANDNGRLSMLRSRLEAEVGAVTGYPFEIFQDREDIHWGQNWEKRLNGTIDATTFLIVAVTPRYLNSPYCRKEFERFLERERQLKRNDLIFPILYIETPAVTENELRARDPIAQAIASRQWVDWRDLRHEPWTNPEIGKRLEKMARTLGKAMSAVSASASGPAPARPKPAADTPKTTGKSVAAAQPADDDTERKLSARVEPPTLIVDPMPRRGDHTRITDAIKAAQPGTRILIRPGLYKEALVLDKPLELIGDGPREEIIIQAQGADALFFSTEFGRVTNLTIVQLAGGKCSAVNIIQGRLELEECDLTSLSLSCIAIQRGADPRIRRNRIHDSQESGLNIYSDGQGTIEDNEIFGNTLAGITIKDGGNPILRRNRIRDGKAGGVFIYSNGRGTIEDNEIWGNAFAGVEIKEGSNPILRRNRIHDGKSGGLFIWKDGLGTIEDNDIWGHNYTGIEVRDNGQPVVRNNRIYKNKQAGIYLHDGGAGTFEDNVLSDNRDAWFIDASSKPKIKASGNTPQP